MINAYIDIASVAIISLVLSFVPPGSGYNLCPLNVISGIYSCTLLAILNSRIKFKVASISTTWKDGPSEMRIYVGRIRRADSSTIGDSLSSTNEYGIPLAIPQESLTRDTLSSGWKHVSHLRSIEITYLIHCAKYQEKSGDFNHTL